MMSKIEDIEPGWTDIEEDLIVYKPKEIKIRKRFALFDMDSTIIKTKSGLSYPRGENDWEFLNDKVIDKFNQIKDRYTIIIISNQSRMKKGGKYYDQIKTKLDNVMKQLPSLYVFIAMGKESKYRKPLVEVDKYLKQINDYNKKLSYYVGDAAGREGDFSDSDKVFAENLGVKFIIPEDYY